MSTDTEDLTVRLEAALSEARDAHPRHPDDIDSWTLAEVVLPFVAAARTEGEQSGYLAAISWVLILTDLYPSDHGSELGAVIREQMRKIKAGEGPS